VISYLDQPYVSSVVPSSTSPPSPSPSTLDSMRATNTAVSGAVNIQRFAPNGGGADVGCSILVCLSDGSQSANKSTFSL
jgi:hypothetical protein